MSRRFGTLLFALVGLAVSPWAARGQTTATNSTAGASPAQDSAPATPAKKVWTNDDVGTLRAESAISTSSPAPRNAKSSTSRAPAAKGAATGKDARWYRDAITKLQAKVPPLDEQIADLQAAMDGKPTGNGTESARPRGVKADSWPAEKDELEKQRAELQSKIDALYDDARRSNIPNGALPLQQ